jgi:hypothetical protein
MLLRDIVAVYCGSYEERISNSLCGRMHSCCEKDRATRSEHWRGFERVILLLVLACKATDEPRSSPLAVEIAALKPASFLCKS